MDAATSIITTDISCFEEKEGLPVEAFAKVQEIFSHVDWLDQGSDFALNVLQHISASNIIQEMSDTESPPSAGISSLLQELSPPAHQERKSQSVLEGSARTSPKDYRNMIINASNIIQEMSDNQKNHILWEEITKSSLSLATKTESPTSPNLSSDTDGSKAKLQAQDSQNAFQLPSLSDVTSQKASKSSHTTSVSHNSAQLSPQVSQHHDTSLPLGDKPLLHDHVSSASTKVTHVVAASPAIPNLTVSSKHETVGPNCVSFSPTTPPAPPPPPPFITMCSPSLPSPPSPQLLPHQFSSSNQESHSRTKEGKYHLKGTDKPSAAMPLPPPQTSSSRTTFSASAPTTFTSTLAPPPPPPPPPTSPLRTPAPDRIANVSLSAPSPPASTSSSSISSLSPTPPPPPPTPPLKEKPASKAGPPPPLYSGPPATSNASSLAPPPPSAPPPPALPSNCSPAPPPPPISKGVSKTNVTSPVPAPPFVSPSSAKGPLSRTISSRSHQTKKLKPLHWLKLTRAVQGSLWAEAQKSGEASKCVLLSRRINFFL